MSQPRMLPFGPLEVQLRLSHGAPVCPETAMAVMLDVDVVQVRRWRAAGMSRLSADRACARRHLHPRELWGDQWEAVWSPAPRRPAAMRDARSVQ